MRQFLSRQHGPTGINMQESESLIGERPVRQPSGMEQCDGKRSQRSTEDRSCDATCSVLLERRSVVRKQRNRDPVTLQSCG